jgi:hypothetical protein
MLTAGSRRSSTTASYPPCTASCTGVRRSPAGKGSEGPHTLGRKSHAPPPPCACASGCTVHSLPVGPMAQQHHGCFPSTVGRSPVKWSAAHVAHLIQPRAKGGGQGVRSQQISKQESSKWRNTSTSRRERGACVHYGDSTRGACDNTACPG